MKHVAMLATLFLLATVPVDAQGTIAITHRGTDIVPSPPRVQEQRPGAASNFTGSVRVAPVFQSIAPGRATGADVTFEPGARTAWHTHPAGQTLIVSDGIGRVQQWGAEPDEIRAGDVVRIPPGVKHWHGASPAAAMTHLAITEPIDGRSVEWMEAVGDSQYLARPRTRLPAPTPARSPND